MNEHKNLVSDEALDCVTGGAGEKVPADMQDSLDVDPGTLFPEGTPVYCPECGATLNAVKRDGVSGSTLVTVCPACGKAVGVEL